MSWPLITLFCYLTIILSIVSVFDLKKRKIANYWSLINFFNYGLFLWLFPDLYRFSLETFQFPLIFFVVSFVLFILKIMGAGDSKFISTFFLTVPAIEHDNLFIIQMILTILIGIFLLLMNSVANITALKQAFIMRDLSIIRRIYGKKFPYSPVILISWIAWGLFYGRDLLKP